MKNHLKIITNIFLGSLSLSVALGTIIKILGPINYNNQINRKFNIASKSRRSNQKVIFKNRHDLFSIFNNKDHKKLDSIKKLEKLIFKWQSLIKDFQDLEVSGFFLSLDNKVYAEIEPDLKLPAASSIKVPILIVLLTMIDQGDIYWNEKLILTDDTVASGSGWMAYEKTGKKFPIFEIASEMIRVSDNTATNLLIKRLGGIKKINSKFNELGLKSTEMKNYLPDLDGTNLTSTKDLTLLMALIDSGEILTRRTRDIFREIMKSSQTNTLIPSGILKGLKKREANIDYQLLLNGYVIYNKTGDIGTSYSDTGLIQTPYNSRAYATFIVKGPFNDPRSPELIRILSAELVPFLDQTRTIINSN